MPIHPPTVRFGNQIIFRNGNKILLSIRKNTGWNDGKYAFVGGHVEVGETATLSAKREALEEIGVRVAERDIKTVLLTHRLNDDYEAIWIFLEIKKWKGVPRNMEPDRCAGIAWFDEKKLPRNTAKYVHMAFAQIKKGIFYNEYGGER